MNNNRLNLKRKKGNVLYLSMDQELIEKIRCCRRVKCLWEEETGGCFLISQEFFLFSFVFYWLISTRNWGHWGLLAFSAILFLFYIGLSELSEAALFCASCAMWPHLVSQIKICLDVRWRYPYVNLTNLRGCISRMLNSYEPLELLQFSILVLVACMF